MARIWHETRDGGEGRDVEDWYCSEHGYIVTTHVGADLACCPRCEDETQTESLRDEIRIEMQNEGMYERE